MLPPNARLTVAGRVLERARAFSDLPPVAAFWYENSNGPTSPSTRGARTASSDLRSAVRFDPLEFEVVVRDGENESPHHVTMARETYEQLTAGKHTPGSCIEAAFPIPP